MKLFGHDPLAAEFGEAISSGRMHHAWLLCGPSGVGKATFAKLAATRMLAQALGAPTATAGLEVPDDNPSARLTRAGNHPDLLLLERLPRDQKMRELPRDQWPADTELARNISIDQVRSLRRRFATRATLSDRRVVIVDAADDLEAGGANALLKSLEEPPAETVFLLICHNPGRLLATIRSRCRALRFSRLDDDQMTAALRQLTPEIDTADLAALVRTGQGAPAQAMRYAGLNIAGLDAVMAELIAVGDPTSSRRSALAAQLSPPAARKRYEAFLRRAPSAIAAHARALRGAALAEAISAWEEARDLAAAAPRLTLDPQSTVFELAGKLAALAPSR